jgi:hypothetical protein
MEKIEEDDYTRQQGISWANCRRQQTAFGVVRRIVGEQKEEAKSFIVQQASDNKLLINARKEACRS